MDSLRSQLPNLNPAVAAKDSLSWIHHLHDTEKRLSETGVGTDEHRAAWGDHDQCKAWETEFQRFALGESGRELRESLAALIKGEISADPAFFSDALRLTQAVVNGYVHNWDWFDRISPQERSQIADTAINFLESFHQPTDNYFLHLATKTWEERIRSAPDAWFKSSAIQDNMMPFRINNRQYAIVTTVHDRSVCIVAPASESQQLDKLFEELNEAGPAYEKAATGRAEYLAEFRGRDMGDWPYEAIDLWQDYTPEMRHYFRLQHEVRAHFFDESEWDKKQRETGSYTNKPREDRVLAIDNVFFSEGISKSAKEEEVFAQQLFFSKAIRSEFEKDFGLSLDSLSLREQFHFQRLVRERTLGDIQPIKDFTHNFGTNGLRTFLVTAGDEALRDKVFGFSQTVSREDAKRVFEAYGQLVGAIDSTGDYLREQFGVESSAAVESIIGKQLNRAKKLLEQAHEYKKIQPNLQHSLSLYARMRGSL